MTAGVHDTKGETMEHKRPGGEMRPANPQEPTRSQLVPLGGTWHDLVRRAWFWPGVATVVVVMLLFSYMGDRSATFTIKLHGVLPVGVPIYTIVFALFILGLTGFAIYRIAGKATAWWVMPAVAAVTAVLTMGPVMDLLQDLTRFGLGDITKQDGLAMRFVKMFFHAGLPEELLKALPVAVGVYLGMKLTQPRSPLWALRVTEPLDGILIGAAAGLGFAFAETIFQYVPRTIIDHGSVTAGLLALLKKLGVVARLPADTSNLQDIASLYGALIKLIGVDRATFELQQLLQSRQSAGLELMIPRLLANICGHAAYAGIFGYFIGLAALKPANRVKTILVGLVLAAAVHAAWNASGGGLLGTVVKLGVFVLLAAVILKARELSPNRSQLAASQLIDRFSRVRRPADAGGDTGATGTAGAAGAAGAGTAAAPQRPAAGAASQRSETWDDGAEVLVIEIGTARVPVAVGARLYERQAPGTQASRGDGIVAEVSASPTDPNVLGLKNLSTQRWHVTTDKGERRELDAGRAIRIARGTRIQLGDLVAEVK
jgi:RsiW-degrading membrane proteinase PrsW (M82 family)